MADTVRELIVGLSLDPTNFTRNLRTINGQIKEFESEFKLAGAGVENFEKTTTGASAKISMLRKKLSEQTNAVKQYENGYDEAQRTLQRHNDELNRTKTRLDTAKTAVEYYTREEGAASQSTKDWQEEEKRLEGQIKSQTKTVQNDYDKVTKWAAGVNNARAEVKNTRAELEKLLNPLTTAGERMQQFGEKAYAAGKVLETAGRSLSRWISTPIATLGTLAAKTAIDFESSMADIAKTVDETAKTSYEDIAKGVEEMSVATGSATDEIATVVATAGQLGIATDVIMDFSKAMIDLGNSAEDLDANTAATVLAKYMNITGLAQTSDNVNALASTVVDLGNNFATTESSIVEMAQNLASTGKIVGMSDAEIMGIAAGLSSVGLESAKGGTAFSKAMKKIQLSVEGTNDASKKSLEDFSRVAGMTSEEFANLWKNDPTSAFIAFISGLSKMDEEGVSAVATLNEIGISEVRLSDTLMRASNANELFKRSIATANTAWREGTALTTEANKRYNTTEYKLKGLKNQAANLAKEFGNDMIPVIQTLIEKANGLLQAFAGLDEKQRNSIEKFAALAASVGPVILVMGRLIKSYGSVATTIGKGLSAVGKWSSGINKTAIEAGKASAGIGDYAKAVAGSKAFIVAATAAVVVGAAALYDYASGAYAARKALEDMQTKADEWKQNQAKTIYSGEGLGFFGMSREDFAKEKQQADNWLEGVKGEWTDGVRETAEDVAEWTDSFTSRTDKVREGIDGLYDGADEERRAQMDADRKTLDELDEEVGNLLSRKAGKNLTDEDLEKLQQYLDMIDELKKKYDSDQTKGFEGLTEALDAELALIEQKGMNTEQRTQIAYGQAIVAAGEGMAQITEELDTEYKKQYAAIQKITDETEREQKLQELNRKYAKERTREALQYAVVLRDLLAEGGFNIDGDAKKQLEDLNSALEQYKNGEIDSEKLAEITNGLDESKITQYIALLEQIQSLKDYGVADETLEHMFPGIYESGENIGLELAQGIADTLAKNDADTTLQPLRDMMEELGSEVCEIMVDLNLTESAEETKKWIEEPKTIEAKLEITTTPEEVSKQIEELTRTDENNSILPFHQTTDRDVKDLVGMLDYLKQRLATAGDSWFANAWGYGATSLRNTKNGDIKTYLTDSEIENLTKLAQTFMGLETTEGLTQEDLDSIESLATMLSLMGETGTGIDVLDRFIEALGEIGIATTQTGVGTTLLDKLTELTTDEMTDKYNAAAESTGTMAEAEAETAEATRELTQAEKEGVEAAKQMTKLTVDGEGRFTALREKIKSARDEIGGFLGTVTDDETRAKMQAYISILEELDRSIENKLIRRGGEDKITPFDEMSIEASSKEIEGMLEKWRGLNTEAGKQTTSTEMKETAVETERANAAFDAFLEKALEAHKQLDKLYESNEDQDVLDELDEVQEKITSMELNVLNQQERLLHGAEMDEEVYNRLVQYGEELDAIVESLKEIAESTGTTAEAGSGKFDEITGKIQAAKEEMTGLLETVTSEGTRRKIQQNIEALDALSETIDTLKENSGSDDNLTMVEALTIESVSSTIDSMLDNTKELTAQLELVDELIEKAEKAHELIYRLKYTTNDPAIKDEMDDETENVFGMEEKIVIDSSKLSRGKLIDDEEYAQLQEFSDLLDGIIERTSGTLTMMVSIEPAGFEDWTQFGFDPGSQIIPGVTQGIESNEDMLHDKMFSVGEDDVYGPFADALDEHSPSRVMAEAGRNIIQGVIVGVNEQRQALIEAMRSAAIAAVQAAKDELGIHSPSKVFENEVGTMMMRGIGEGVLKETENQARMIRNAAGYLTTSARGGVNVDGRRVTNTYADDNSVSVSGNFYVRSEQDIKDLAEEIAGLTKRHQRGRGMRMA